MVFHVMDDDELDFAFNGPDAVRRVGDAGSLELQSAALREGYLKAAASSSMKSAAAARRTAWIMCCCAPANHSTRHWPRF